MDARRPSLLPAVAVALAATAARAIAFSPTELYSDEAYYWLWSRRLAAGYFDHPPAIAWLVRGGTALAAGELGVRLVAIACGGAAIVFAALLARELSEEPRAPLWAALLAASAPLLHLAGALATPDAPLVAATAAAVWLIARARGPGWIAAGVAVGVALLSKYTAGLLAPSLILLVLLDPPLRAQLRTPWPWAGALVALVLFAPCLAWNARHGWVSIAFQLRHGFAQNASWGSFLEFLASQAVGAGPVVLAAGVAFLVRPRTSAAVRTAALVLVPLAVTVVSAARGKVEANWPALVYPALAASAAAALAGLRRRVGPALVGASVLASALLLGGFAAEQRSPRLLVGTPIIERFHGWRELARAVGVTADAACPAIGCDPRAPFIIPANYQYAAELAYYGGFSRFGPALERRSQLDVWGAHPRRGEPVLVVGFDGMAEGWLGRLRATGQGATERTSVAYRGHTVRTVTVTPFAHYAGELAER